ncbi:hypothetical protein VTK73DRAFT_2174 [Phialemonium thermophilum]|uniref:Uncharacterized protein n=1 Tax=Phialemonium thermophilum TaxID=223376 RepID=A0ABR3VSH2_9PEZI
MSQAREKKWERVGHGRNGTSGQRRVADWSRSVQWRKARRHTQRWTYAGLRGRRKRMVRSQARPHRKQGCRCLGGGELVVVAIRRAVAPDRRLAVVGLLTGLGVAHGTRRSLAARGGLERARARRRQRHGRAGWPCACSHVGEGRPGSRAGIPYPPRRSRRLVKKGPA